MISKALSIFLFRPLSIVYIRSPTTIVTAVKNIPKHHLFILFNPIEVTIAIRPEITEKIMKPGFIGLLVRNNETSIPAIIPNP